MFPVKRWPQEGSQDAQKLLFPSAILPTNDNPWRSVCVLCSVQFSRSVVSDSLRPHESQHARPPCPLPTPGVHSKLTSIKSVMLSSHLILCCPLLLLPPIPPSIRVFSNESTLRMRWPKYCKAHLSTYQFLALRILLQMVLRLQNTPNLSKMIS